MGGEATIILSGLTSLRHTQSLPDKHCSAWQKLPAAVARLNNSTCTGCGQEPIIDVILSPSRLAQCSRPAARPAACLIATGPKICSIWSFSVQSRDPRWLVEPRPDGTNVNGWHWQDKNRFAWAKERLEQAVPELPPAQTGNARITKVTDVVGEVRQDQAAAVNIQRHAVTIGGM